MEKAILFVGYRKKAVACALQLGYQVVVWDEKTFLRKPDAKPIHCIIAPFLSDADKFPAELLNQLTGYSVTSIIATTEKAVIPAAILRKLCGLNGHSPDVATRCHDKYTMKLAAQARQIPITPFILIGKDSQCTLLAQQLQYPIVLKQRALSGSRGLVIAKDEFTLKKSMRENLLAEKFIQGKEYSVESFIHDKKIVFTNITEYYKLKFINIVPARLSSELQQQILALNQLIIEHFAIECGMTHLELYVTNDNAIIFGEIALRPPGGYIMDLLEMSYGFNPWEAFISLEQNLPYTFPMQAQQISCAVLIHPGAGIVQTMQDFTLLKKLPGVHSYRCKLKAGMQVKQRAGTGEDYGHVLFTAKNRTQLLNTLKEVQRITEVTLRNNFPSNK